MTADMEISIPCIIKIRLRNPRGYSGPVPGRDIMENDYRGSFGIANDSLIIQKIRSEIVNLKPSNFNSCLSRQFSENLDKRGFLFDEAEEHQYICYEADLHAIRIVPLEVKTMIVERV